MSSWGDIARAAINRANDLMPEDVSLKDRIKAVDAAFPFGSREYWPYKAWLKVRREYLCRYGYVPRGASREPAPLFPALERDPVSGRPVIP